ncbi:helix-turn-helix domain-containing protein [Brevibacterium samyangense]|uniref:HTH marR-type domain-containing protein n=1 Tax=Brevibacterium samyangense TaxID=366888 RepID=A0ABN2TDU7_9MICO
MTSTTGNDATGNGTTGTAGERLSGDGTSGDLATGSAATGDGAAAARKDSTDGIDSGTRIAAMFAHSVLALAREIGLRHDAVEGLGRLTPTEQLVLRHVDRNPTCSPSDIARGTGLRRPNVSAAIATLMKKDMVVRETDLEDARSARISCTSLAQEDLRLLLQVWADAVREGLPPEVTPQMLELSTSWLDSVTARMQESRAEE